MNFLANCLLKNLSYELSEISLFKIEGKDAFRYTQGQVTQDLKLIKEDRYAKLSTLLNPDGKVNSFFYIFKSDEDYFFLVDSVQEEAFKSRFEKFAIMDDVSLIRAEVESGYLWIGESAYRAFDELEESVFLEGFIYPVVFSFSKLDCKFEEISLEDYQSLKMLSGIPTWNLEVDEKSFINDSFLNELAISYDKGCFVGQEVVSKINNNRGGAYYPTLIEVRKDAPVADFFIGERKGGKVVKNISFDGKTYLYTLLYRDFRVLNRKVELSFEDEKLKGTVLYLPLIELIETKEKLSNESFMLGVKKFNEDEKSDLALNLLKIAIKLNPKFSDGYEALGALHGRRGEFQKGIDIMDQLLKVDENSVMAHTNKSLFYMKLGQIEKAEEEKGHATFKSFAKNGEEAKRKEILEKKKEEELQAALKREKMFLEVLKIDAEDEMANFGLGEIFFMKKEYEKSITHFQKVLDKNQKYSVAYLGLGNVYIEIGEIEKAKEIFNKGIKIAAKNGELMPANKMQAKLSAIS